MAYHPFWFFFSFNTRTESSSGLILPTAKASSELKSKTRSSWNYKSASWLFEKIKSPNVRHHPAEKFDSLPIAHFL